MIDADALDLDLHLEAAREFSKPQTQVVSQIDLLDGSFTAAFRGAELTLKDLESHLRDHLGLNRVNAKQEFMLANAWIKSTLRGFVSSLPEGVVKSELSAENVSMTDLLRVLKYCSESQRQKFVLELLTLETKDHELGSFIADKLDNALHYLPASEKGALITLLLAKGTQHGGEYVSAVLRSSQSLPQLQAIVDDVGVEKLLKLADAGVNEYLAHALITSKVREVCFPKPGEALFEETQLASLLAAYQSVHSICHSQPELVSTKVAQDFLITITDDLRELEADLEAISQSEHSTPELISDTIQRYCRAAELEFRYCVNLSRGMSSHLSEDEDAEVCRAEEFGVDMLGPTVDQAAHLTLSGDWTLADLDNVEAVLCSLPESDLLFTPLLREIERVPSLGWGVLGVRFHHGLIQIADSSIDNAGIEKNYDGVDSLKIVLTHEIGHGIQIGDGFSGIHYHGNGESTFGAGEEAIDFDEWSELSDWTTYHRGRFAPGDTYGTIKLDGQEYPLSRPTDVNGKEVVFLYDSDWNVLISYRADADFSNRWYARTNPWEDFAEAFSEYFFLPERLIADAPEKFKHLEEEFKRYSGNAKLEALLDEALSKKK